MLSLGWASHDRECVRPRGEHVQVTDELVRLDLTFDAGINHAPSGCGE